jgi:hypothetical protein
MLSTTDKSFLAKSAIIQASLWGDAVTLIQAFFFCGSVLAAYSRLIRLAT